jgi:hypothetical protein
LNHSPGLQVGEFPDVSRRYNSNLETGDLPRDFPPGLAKTGLIAYRGAIVVDSLS